MDREPYAVALKNALTEINKAYPDIKNSFIFTNSGDTITGEQTTDEKTITNVQESFEAIKEKAEILGNLKSFCMTGKNGKLTVSSIDDMYLVLATSKNADTTQINSIVHVILPTIMKTVETISPAHLQPLSSKELVVDILSGFFAGDSVQIDAEIMMDWIRDRMNTELTEEPDLHEIIDHVRIETFGGYSTLCKVKEISDEALQGKNVIRIPEKVCNSLEIKKGDKVKVQPFL